MDVVGSDAVVASARQSRLSAQPVKQPTDFPQPCYVVITTAQRELQFGPAVPPFENQLLWFLPVGCINLLDVAISASRERMSAVSGHGGVFEKLGLGRILGGGEGEVRSNVRGWRVERHTRRS